ncbi:MAG: SagB/ThcOx family dehydrogenase [Desulfobulbaceae bacterium]|nr:SagB/ThcOx family dehydrogenase [Desulfobulbaceae bacterium]
MDAKRFADNRFLLKDTIRQQVDFSQTGQAQHRPAPPMQQDCAPSLYRISLPDGQAALTRLAVMPVATAIALRESVRSYSDAPLSLEELSGLLWAVQGVRRVAGPTTALRTVPSAGARHSFETYLALSRVAGLPAGIYRYLPFGHELVQIKTSSDVALKASEACLRQGCVARAAVSFFWTTVPARMEWRYDLAAHKVIALDAGHVGQNLYLAAEAMGMGVCAIAGYDEEKGDALVGVDGEEEFTIYIATVGKKKKIG